MDNASNAESSRSREDEYYNYSPLEIFNDSYFSHPVPYDEQNSRSFARGGLRTEGFGVTNYTGLTDSTPQQIPQQIPQQMVYKGYQTQTPMDIDVLSAENYQEGVYPRRRSRDHDSGSIELYGGFLATSPNEKDSGNPPTTTKNRRSKKEISASADESGTRQRGRPRLDTRDQTAAERRRTQIRLAQRAYRQRKETTISGLNERVTSLEKTIDDMNKTLTEFHDLAIASGIERGSPSLARSLQSTVGRFAELAKNSTHESDIEEEGEDPAISVEQFAVEQPQQSNPRRRAEAPESHPSAMLGYQTTLEEDADDYDGEIAQKDSEMRAQLENLPRSSDWTSTEAMQQYQIETSDPTGDTEYGALSTQQYRVEIPDPTEAAQDFVTTELSLMLGKPVSFSDKSLYDFYALPLPNSYSHRETSFARRLLRIATEESYRIMTDPNSRPEEKRRFCRFTWCFANSSGIINHMEKTLAKSAQENLELWEAPRLHLGGAGLHFPRVGIDAGGEAPPAWWANEAPMGPWLARQPETPPVPNSMAVSEIIKTAGMEGEWFDANDVEQYLRSKGLLLDGQSQIVEIIDTDDSIPELMEVPATFASSPGDSSSRGSSGGPLSPLNPELLWSSDPFLQSADYLWNEGLASVPEVPDVGMDISYTGYTDPKAFMPPLDFDLSAAALPTFNIKLKKFVHIEKFLSNMVQSNVCLGRTPGFRRADVDSALALATVEQY